MVCVCGDQGQFLSTKAERSGESVAGKVAGLVSHTSLSPSLTSGLKVEGSIGRVEAGITRRALLFRAHPGCCLKK